MAALRGRSFLRGFFTGASASALGGVVEVDVIDGLLEGIGCDDGVETSLVLNGLGAGEGLLKENGLAGLLSLKGIEAVVSNVAVGFNTGENDIGLAE